MTQLIFPHTCAEMKIVLGCSLILELSSGVLPFSGLNFITPLLLIPGYFSCHQPPFFK